MFITQYSTQKSDQCMLNKATVDLVCPQAITT